ncbi:MAG: hypothetical protein ABIU09_13130 [Pyrinomonadaceae bacterium]
MQEQEAQMPQKRCRKNERGAALVMVLLISFLLLVALTALLLEASMNTANVTDATAEEQAYYAAESGIQSAVNVLRANTVPNPLINPSPSPTPSTDNKIDYFKAVKLCTSNISCNCGTGICTNALDNVARLSRWMTYDVNFPDRVILGDPATYTQQNGLAYSVRVENPDNVGNAITYSALGYIGTTGSLSRTWPGATAADSATITYVPKTTTSLDVSTGQANDIDFGKFVISYRGAGATIPTRTRFAINANLTVPYNATKVIRGFFEVGTIGPTTNAWILYDSQAFVVTGSTITLSPLPGCSSPNCGIYDPTPPDLLPLPDGYYRIGYKITPNAPAAPDTPTDTRVVGSITAPEPIRLVIRSTGYGPHGARKELESVIQKNYFNGLGAPSPLTLIGPPCTPVGTCTPTLPPTNSVAPAFVFNPGTATGTVYSGKDVLLKAFLPPVGLTHDLNVDRVQYGVVHPPPNKYNGKVFGVVSNITDELPFWLQSPKNLDATLQQLKAVADASGKYYAPGVTPPNAGGGRYGDPVNATGITYIDGDLEFSQEGGGILVVTGGLTFKGGFEFNGLIVVTGAAGISRTGGGSGSLQGNMIVAPYIPSGITCFANNVTCFLAPRYDISGGGSSEIVYNSNNVANGLGAITNIVKGVAEK